MRGRRTPCAPPGSPAAYAELRGAADALLSTNSFLYRWRRRGSRPASSQPPRLGRPRRSRRRAGAHTRRDHPASPYFEYPPVAAARSAGDVVARFHVMQDEAADSVRLIGELLQAGTGPAWRYAVGRQRVEVRARVG